MLRAKTFHPELVLGATAALLPVAAMIPFSGIAAKPAARMPKALESAYAIYDGCLTSQLKRAAPPVDRPVPQVTPEDIEAAIANCAYTRDEAGVLAEEALEKDKRYADPVTRKTLIDTAFDGLNQRLRNAAAPTSGNTLSTEGKAQFALSRDKEWSPYAGCVTRLARANDNLALEPLLRRIDTNCAAYRQSARDWAYEDLRLKNPQVPPPRNAAAKDELLNDLTVRLISSVQTQDWVEKQDGAVRAQN